MDHHSPERMDRDLTSTTSDLIDLGLGTVQAARNARRIDLSERFQNEERFQTGTESVGSIRNEVIRPLRSHEPKSTAR